MDPGDTDWGGLNLTEPNEVDSMIDAYQKNDVNTIGSGDVRSDTVYDNTSMGVDDDYMNTLVLYDGYDSYNESGESSEEDEENQGDYFSSFQTFPQTGFSKPTQFRFMNGKDGMATCEKCGTVGIKHAFYSKSKRFCSLSCSRSFATARREGKPSPPPYKEEPPPKKLHVLASKGRQTPKKHSKQSMGHSQKSTTRFDSFRVFDWGPYLVSTGSQAAPVSCFKHVPMSDCWDQMTVGMKVEVANSDNDVAREVYWIATVIKIAGYKALMRYEGFSSDASKDFWLNLCTQDVHPVGWCATVGKPLVPPKTIQHKYLDWKDFLVKRLTGARTLPNNFYNKVLESMENHRFHRGVQVEVVDKMCVSAMRVAIVHEVIGGRLRLAYMDKRDENDEFWCDMKSPLIHHVGWAQRAGHKLHATPEYKAQCLTKITMQKFDPDDSMPDMFPKTSEPPHGLKFQAGMKLEAIDPLNLSTICVATVMKCLRNNFLMIGIDGSIAQNGTDWFCYHASSPCIFPVGFCEINGLQLTPPRGHKGPFKWFDYLKHTKAVAAPVKLFDKEIPKHGFKPGMKVEAVDLMEPRLICVATVTKVVGRLMKIHFDGWENDYDQWVDAQTPDLYPVGWCEIMSYPLEGPRIKTEQVLAPSPPIPKKKRGKTQIYKGPRKKRKSKPLGKPLPPNFNFVPSFGDEDDIVCPPHVPLPPETVAATLPPLLDPSNTSELAKPATVKTEGVDTPQLGSVEVPPPILSPNGPVDHTPPPATTTVMPTLTQNLAPREDNSNKEDGPAHHSVEAVPTPVLLTTVEPK
ncbi:MBT domain-containing protein 1-like [Haliotis cracherodii]|uniref:MBT domain-containing protein 1-like n=1 Tax=Haliotis cracherodii TaxID=6455 RepID=UPI0039ED4C4A